MDVDPEYESKAIDFLLDKSLYSPTDDVNLISAILNFDLALDCHCTECGKHSIFKTAHKDLKFAWHMILFFRCSRNNKHQMYFILRQAGNSLEKIGQFPSLADIHSADTKKYAKLLGANYAKEFNRAIGLHAHSVGVGSFVYLRRIFESLIENARKVASKEKGWNAELYEKSRMAERISLLSHHLPDFLVDHKHLYSILSKGIHELSEEECIKAFDTVKLGIESILDEKLHAQERERKIKDASGSINKLMEQLKEDEEYNKLIE